MENIKVEWKKPVIKSTTFEEIAKFIRAMAESPGGTACSTPCATPEPPSCEGCGSCSCSAECNALALHWSCSTFFVIVGR